MTEKHAKNNARWPTIKNKIYVSSIHVWHVSLRVGRVWGSEKQLSVVFSLQVWRKHPVFQHKPIWKVGYKYMNSH